MTLPFSNINAVESLVRNHVVRVGKLNTMKGKMAACLYMKTVDGCKDTWLSGMYKIIKTVGAGNQISKWRLNHD